MVQELIVRGKAICYRCDWRGDAALANDRCVAAGRRFSNRFVLIWPHRDQVTVKKAGCAFSSLPLASDYIIFLYKHTPLRSP
jgi:hypothetical protein